MTVAGFAGRICARSDGTAVVCFRWFHLEGAWLSPFPIMLCDCGHSLIPASSHMSHSLFTQSGNECACLKPSTHHRPPTSTVRVNCTRVSTRGSCSHTAHSLLTSVQTFWRPSLFIIWTLSFLTIQHSVCPRCVLTLLSELWAPQRPHPFRRCCCVLSVRFQDHDVCKRQVKGFVHV